MKSIRSRALKFDIFQRVNVGTALVAIGLVLALLWPQHIAKFAVFMAFYVAIFLWRRPRDEFELACWQAGCAATFRAVLAAVILIPFLGGLLSGLTQARTITPSKTTVYEESPYKAQIAYIMDLAPSIAFVAFLYGFQRKRLKGE